MPERMTEAKVAELEDEYQRAERDDEVTRERAAKTEPTIGRLLMGMVGPELAKKRSAFLEARAQLEQQKREDADAATARMVAANQRMAEASEAAAKASADAARWAKWAAIFTALAAGLTLVGTIIQARGR